VQEPSTEGHNISTRHLATYTNASLAGTQHHCGRSTSTKVYIACRGSYCTLCDAINLPADVDLKIVIAFARMRQLLKVCGPPAAASKARDSVLIHTRATLSVFC
jgi:hypothetical protein